MLIWLDRCVWQVQRTLCIWKLTSWRPEEWSTRLIRFNSPPSHVHWRTQPLLPPCLQTLWSSFSGCLQCVGVLILFVKISCHCRTSPNDCHIMTCGFALVFVRKAMFSIPIIIPKEGCLRERKNGEWSFHFCKTLVAVEYIELWASCIGWKVKRRHDKGKWTRSSQMLKIHEIWQDRNYSNST